MAAPSDVGDALQVIENIFQKSFILSTVISQKKGKQKGLMLKLSSANAHQIYIRSIVIRLNTPYYCR